MKITKGFFICLFLQIISIATLFSQGIILNALPVENGVVEVHNDESFQTLYTASGLGFTLGSKASSSQIRYDIEIVNNSSQDFFFDVNNIQLYSGHFDKNKWTRQSFADYAADSSEKEEEMDNAKLIAAGILVGVITIGTFFLFDYLRDSKNDKKTADKKSKDEKSKPESTPPKSKPPKHKPLYAPVNPHHDLIDDIIFWNFIDSINENPMAPVSGSNSISSKIIKAGEKYYGSFYVAASSNPDYKFCYSLSDSQEIEMIFVGNESYFKSLKSENTSIFNNSEQEDILAFDLGFNSAGGLNLYVMLLGNPLGAYFSGGFYFTNYETEVTGSIKQHSFSTFIPDDYDKAKDYIFRTTGDYERDVIEFNLGMTVKVFPHIWLLAGCGIDITFKNYYGNVYSRTKTSTQYTFDRAALVMDKTPYFVFLPQLGLDLSIGPVNIGTVCKYNIEEGPMMDFLFGLSF